MKKRIFTIGCIATVAILMALVGSVILPASTSSGTAIKLIPVTGKNDMYESAIVGFVDSGVATMEITTIQQLVTNGEVFSERTQKSLSYRGYNTEQLIAASNELLQIGEHSVEISEAFTSGTAYVTIDRSNFSASYSAQEYQKRLIPAALIDSALYRTIDIYDNTREYLLYFKHPTSVENWAVKSDWEFADAQGFASIDHNGNLLKSAYSITYQHLILGEVKDVLHFTVYIDYKPAAAEIQLTEDPSEYTRISYLDGPRMLEKASGYLLQAGNVSAHYSDRIFCQAFGDERTKSISLFTADSNNFSARIDTETVLTNTGRVGDVTRHTHNELFVDGVYTIRADQGESTQNTNLTSETIKNYCKDQLVSTIMMPQDIMNTEISDIENTLKIVITPSEAFAALVSSNACQTLYQKPAILNELATNSTTEKLECYLIVDKYTNLPISSGIEFSGLYAIEGIPYNLQYKADQSYNIASTDAQKQINEAAGQ